jgi:CHASE3 domain sensor protein
MNGPNRGKINTAQCTLELTLSFIVMVMVLIGVLRVFVWAANTMSQRHNEYIRDFTSIYATNEIDDPLTPPDNAILVPDEVIIP